MGFETSLQYLLKWEGGYGNNPHDAGGATNLGVIQEEYDRYRDRKNLSRQSVRHISNDEAEEIYKTEYWCATQCDELNEGVANCLFDSDVNSGDRRGVEWLQRAINSICGRKIVLVDGKAGDKTIYTAKGLSPPQLIDEMLNIRLAFLHAAKNSKTGEALWPVFGHGWQKRINGVRAQSHSLCGVSAPQPPLISPPPTPEKPMSDLAPILSLAKVIAPALAAALEQGNPLSGVAVSLLSAALQTSPDALSATAASAGSGPLAAAIQLAETQLAAHVKAASAPAPQPPAPIATDTSIYVDPTESIVKYVLGGIGVALLGRAGFSIDVANGIVGNVVPVIWTFLAGVVPVGIGWLQHRAVIGSNTATAQLVKKS